MNKNKWGREELTDRTKKIKNILLNGVVNKIEDIFSNSFISSHNSEGKTIKGIHLILGLT